MYGMQPLIGLDCHSTYNILKINLFYSCQPQEQAKCFRGFAAGHSSTITYRFHPIQTECRILLWHIYKLLETYENKQVPKLYYLCNLVFEFIMGQLILAQLNEYLGLMVCGESLKGGSREGALRDIAPPPEIEL